MGKKIKYFLVFRLCLLALALLMCAILVLFQNNKFNKSENNVLFVLDVSNSMNTQDIASGKIKISRLNLAKNIVKRIIESEQNANYGLVIFSQIANQYIPLTNDTGTFLDYLNDINTSILPGGGTQMDSIGKVFSGNNQKYSKVIILSDAESGVKKVQNAKIFDGAKAYFIGLGTEKGEWVRYSNGNIVRDKGIKVISKFDHDNASMLSKQFDAKLFELKNNDGFDVIIREIIASESNFSYSQIQFLIILLGLFTIFLL